MILDHLREFYHFILLVLINQLLLVKLLSIARIRVAWNYTTLFLLFIYFNIDYSDYSFK